MQLSDALVALFQAPFDDASVSASQLVTGYVAAFQEMTAFAAQVDGINPTTQDLVDRQTSSDIFITAAMTACFAAICEAMAGKSSASAYTTADDVQSDLSTLSDDWDILAERSIDPDIRAQLSAIYTRIATILQNLEVTLPNIATFNVPAIPASVLSYWLYETDADTDTLVALNPAQPPWLFDGVADILVTPDQG